MRTGRSQARLIVCRLAPHINRGRPSKGSHHHDHAHLLVTSGAILLCKLTLNETLSHVRYLSHVDVAFLLGQSLIHSIDISSLLVEADFAIFFSCLLWW